MTIVVTVKVTDGIVLAADSATSFTDAAGHVAKVYNSANKIFQFGEGLADWCNDLRCRQHWS
jgi:hypothetical protein